jgi:hypothetical protein
MGALLARSDALTPTAGSVTLGLYTAGVAGVGFAFSGLVRTSIAAGVVALVVTVTLLIDLIAGASRPTGRCPRRAGGVTAGWPLGVRWSSPWCGRAAW